MADPADKSRADLTAFPRRNACPFRLIMYSLHCVSQAMSRIKNTLKKEKKRRIKVISPPQPSYPHSLSAVSRKAREGRCGGEIAASQVIKT